MGTHDPELGGLGGKHVRTRRRRGCANDPRFFVGIVFEQSSNRLVHAEFHDAVLILQGEPLELLEREHRVFQQRAKDLYTLYRSCCWVIGIATFTFDCNLRLDLYNIHPSECSDGHFKLATHAILQKHSSAKPRLIQFEIHHQVQPYYKSFTRCTEAG